ncbi:hypothetical protein JZ751_025168 [Albula glossodonta]|uniref:SH2 domain-containing protein n=1 Tax=Albula glossodonta TaxID=121402 RepID=A0A8T2PHS6_9TELE|nr:hypothetical protein JZ751_025168 [Albula glossodonta]
MNVTQVLGETGTEWSIMQREVGKYYMKSRSDAINCVLLHTCYVEKLELSGFISLTDDGSRGPKLEAARLNLRLKDGDVKLTAPSLEARELWKGYIYAVVELSIPSYLNLMPGQRLLLKSVIERERERRRPPSPPPSAAASSLYLSVQGDMPACFHSVSRTEAEVLLEKHPGFGNLLLRPGRDGISLAVTTYQDLNGPVFRHYRLARKPDGGFSIEVENPVACATLSDVIDHLVETTSGVLKPFVMETHYDQSISKKLSQESCTHIIYMQKDTCTHTQTLMHTCMNTHTHTETC